MALNVAQASIYRFSQGEKDYQVHPDRAQDAQKIDKNQDHELSDQEIVDHLRANLDMPDPDLAQVDVDKVLQDYKNHLQNIRPEQTRAYRSYDQIAAELERLEQTYPDLCQRVSLGETAEGRQIWALKVSKNAATEDTSNRPAVVVTGCHHAREWATTEVPLAIANDVLAAYGTDETASARLENAELWFVPLVNPDGYEYSRNENSWWRKNRRPVTETGCGPVSGNPVGVDLNRNYYDGNPDHAYIWRPVGDEPCNYRDDGRATSDNPARDTYRGPNGASEVEIQKLLELELGRGNVKGVLDYHSYGGMILYPWGNTREEVPEVDTYREIGNRMNDALGNQRYRLMQSVSLYPTSGGSHDIHHANGILSITMEIGTSFHPSEEELGPLVDLTKRPGIVFIDEILQRQSPPPEPPPPPPPPPPPQPDPEPPSWWDRCNPFS